ncbi:MAG: hypothetical protein ACI9VS_003243, partial [Candidatus Binatia bacterium]
QLGGVLAIAIAQDLRGIRRWRCFQVAGHCVSDWLEVLRACGEPPAQSARDSL